MKNILQTLVKWPIINEKTINQCVNYLREAKLSIPSGDILDEFENNFSDYTGSSHCLAQNNGTSALFSAYFALGLKSGDEIIVPSFTWTATVTAMIPLGINPVFCDIDSETWTIDPDDIIRKITSRTKAICVVHMWGNVCNMKQIMKIVKQYGLFLIEDCSHAHGAMYQNRYVGTFGDIGCFSMQATKPLAGGELGAVITNNDSFFDRMVKLGHQGRIEKIAISDETKEFVGGLGYKFRPFPIPLIIANEHLKEIFDITRNRQKMAYYFDKELNQIPVLKTQRVFTEASRTLYFYVFRIDISNEDQRSLINELVNAGYPVRKMHYRLVHYVAPFNKMKVTLPVSEDIIQQLLVLEVINTSSDDLLQWFASDFAQEIKKFLSRRGLIKV